MFARKIKSSLFRRTAVGAAFAVLVAVGPGAGNAFAAAQTPAAPSSVSVAAGSAANPGSIDISATFASNSGARQVLTLQTRLCLNANYTVGTATCSSWITGITFNVTAGAGTATYNENGLTGGAAYWVQVQACNTAPTPCSGWQAATQSVATSSSSTVPDAPAITSVTRADASAVVLFTAPANNGGSAITDYKVEYQTGAGAWTTFSHAASGSVLTYTVTGLTNGTLYNFRVSAINAIGTSAVSGTSSATPATTPGAPAITSFTRGNTQATVVFTAPGSNGGSAITDYLVEYQTGAGAWTTFSHAASASTLTYTITGLTNGSSYNVRVSAVNAVGTGTASSTSSATPATTPGAPSITSFVRGNTQATVTFTAPSSNGGASITDYVVEYKLSSVSTWTTWSHVASGSTLSYRLTGLTNGSSYDVRVSATNSVGTGSVSTTSTTTPATVPGIPPRPKVVTGNGQAAVTFSAAANGGDAITNYLVEYKLSSAGTWSTFSHAASASTTTYSITGLTNGSAYDVRVSAVNAAGTGTASSTSSVQLLQVTFTVLGTSPNQTVTVTGCVATCPSSLVIPSTIDGNPVTTIAGYSFDGENGITSVVIPSSVTVIGYKAFWGASANPLSLVTRGSLTSVTLASGLTSISGYAFASQPALTSLTIPNTVTTVGPYAFRHDTTLASVNLGTGLTSLGDWAFHDCPALTSVSIPSGVTSIGKATFFGDSSLASVTFPSGLVSLGSYAFSGTSLVNVTLPASVTTIANSVFRGIPTLASLSAGANLVSVGDYAFGNNDYVAYSFAGNLPNTFSASAFASRVLQGAAYVNVKPGHVTITRQSGATGWPANLGGLPVSTI